MSILDEVGRLFGAGRGSEGTALLERAAARGDGEALYALANWRLYGLNGRRDLGATHALLARAGDRRDARLLRARLIANGIGVAANADAARAMLDRLAADDPAVAAELMLADAPEPTPASLVTLSADPFVARIAGFATPDECAWLIARGGPRLQPSFIVDPATRRRAAHPFRDSLGTNFGPAQEDLVVRRLNRRIAAATGTDLAAGEPLHLLAYAPGQQYRPHLDAIPGAANQRVTTLILWLNDDYAGGETAFPDLGLSIRGTAGDALVFANLDAAGRPDPRTRHAGLPVTGGRKWIATRWIRAAPTSPFEAA